MLMERPAIFDIHVHVLGQPVLDAEFMEFAREWRMPFAASCLGADGAMLTDPTFDQCRKANDLVLRLMQTEPGLAHGFCYVSQAHDRQAVEEIRRCVGAGMKGIKLWVAVKCNDERTFPIAKAAIDLGVPILIHSYLRWEETLPGESKPPEIAELAARYPALTIIMAHMAFRWKEGVDAVRDHPNIFVDTSGMDPELGSVEYAVRQLGVDRVLFGSDAPGRDVLCQIGRVMAADISPADRDTILHVNSEKLLGLTGGAR